MHILHSEKNRNTDKRKRALELIEILVVVAVCIIMYFHERGATPRADGDTLPALGDRVLFGTYLGEPIEWRVIRNGNRGEVVLLSEHILTMKAFNAADSGDFNYDDDGNSYWSVGRTEADVNIRARPTAQAVRQDQTTWYNMYSLELGIEAYYWWLREPVPDTASNCYVVDIGYRSRLLRGDKAVGLEGFGVRPAVKVDTGKITLSGREPERVTAEETQEPDSQE